MPTLAVDAGLAGGQRELAQVELELADAEPVLVVEAGGGRAARSCGRRCRRRA